MGRIMGAMLQFEEILYGGWSRCYKLGNDGLELLVTGEVGPRVIRLAAPDGPNLFYEAPEQLGKTGGNEWRIYGGHRFWHAPEAKPRSYYPDNEPLEVRWDGVSLVVRQPLETTTGLQKELELRLHPEKPLLRLTHRLVNRSLWPLRLAPWALSVMRAGGTAVVPLPPRGAHPEALLPSSTLTLWPYTDLSDRRWTFGRRYLRLAQDSRAQSPQKIGASVPGGWCAALVGGYAFVKLFTFQAGAEYPDLGSSVEVFTNKAMLELETLGPLQTLEPGASLEHLERWALFKLPEVPESEDELEEALVPLVETARGWQNAESGSSPST